MIIRKIIIPGRLPGLNEYIKACGRHYMQAARMKSDSKQLVAQHLHSQLKHRPLQCPVKLHYRYFEPNRKRDLSNITGYFHKIFEDTLVSEGYIPDDGWDGISGFTDSFEVDSENPRVEITIYAYGKGPQKKPGSKKPRRCKTDTAGGVREGD